MKNIGLLVAVAKIGIILSVLGLNGPTRDEHTASPATAPDTGFSLQSIHQKIQDNFAEVRHMKAIGLFELSEASQNIVLFDVREVDEYSVSHLANAVRVAPDISAQTFVERHAGRFKNKIAIFYCSVGMRSSDLIRRLRLAGHTNSALAVYNLEGGIFNWHNEFRAVVSRTGKTQLIHPYNEYWGELLKRRDRLRYRPG